MFTWPDDRLNPNFHIPNDAEATYQCLGSTSKLQESEDGVLKPELGCKDPWCFCSDLLCACMFLVIITVQPSYSLNQSPKP